MAGIIGARNGIAKGIAPEATLLSLKVLGHSGMGSNDAVSEAIRYATEHKADIISMSLGGGRPDAQMHSAIQRATSAGIIVVCAAGNDGRGRVSYPAAYPYAIAVAATQFDETTTFYSNWGKEIDIAAISTVSPVRRPLVAQLVVGLGLVQVVGATRVGVPW